MAPDHPRHSPSQYDSALARARESGKKILVEYGGDWCGGAVSLAALLDRPAVAALIKRHFIHVRCRIGPDGHSMSPGIPIPVELDAIPFFGLVDAEGRIVATQRTEPFEFLWWYRESKVVAFLQAWARR